MEVIIMIICNSRRGINKAHNWHTYLLVLRDTKNCRKWFQFENRMHSLFCTATVWLPYYCYFDTILAYYRLDFPAMNLASGNLPFWFCSFDHRCRTFHLSLEFQFASVLRILGHHNPTIQFGPPS